MLCVYCSTQGCNLNLTNLNFTNLNPGRNPRNETSRGDRIDVKDEMR